MVLCMMGIHLLRITLKISAISRDPLSERHLNEHINLIVPNVMREGHLVCALEWVLGLCSV